MDSAIELSGVVPAVFTLMAALLAEESKLAQVAPEDARALAARCRLLESSVAISLFMMFTLRTLFFSEIPRLMSLTAACWRKSPSARSAK